MAAAPRPEGSYLPGAAKDGALQYMVLRDLRSTHVRRARVMIVVTSILIMLIFGYWAAFFASERRWGIFAVDCGMILLGGLAWWLVIRERIFAAATTLGISLIPTLLCMAIFLDVPSDQVPRSIHHYLIPAALGSYLILRGESARVAHAIALVCLVAVVALDSSGFAVRTEYALPDEVRRIGTWVNNGLAMLALYLLVNVFVGDINRMEGYLHGANNRFVGLVSGMFPRPIAERLLGSGNAFPERHSNCSVLFADIVGFTSLSERLTPEELVGMLSEVFARFDQCVEQLGLTKIKTIGDAYMVAAGVPRPHPEHARVLVEMAKRMLEDIQHFPQIDLRIGIASGELVAGVIGKSRQIYDVWGDVVNMAARMESHGLPGRVQIDQNCHDLVGRQFEFERRAGITIKGKHGTHDVYLLRPSTPTTAVPT